MTIRILEDETQHAQQLTAYLTRFQAEHPDVTLRSEVFDRGHKLLDGYRTDADLLLLDIQLPDMTGMEVARRIRDRDPAVMIIFVTNLAQYAIEGYSVGAFDYILKPVNYFSFSRKLERAVRVLSHREVGLALDLKTKTGSLRLMVDEVSFIEVAAHEVNIHTRGDCIRQWGTLSQYEERLRDAHFARCNASFLVNLKFVQEVRRDQAILLTGDQLTISRTYRKDFLGALAQYRGGSN